MPREAAPSTNERDFVLAALRENVRLDGRARDQFRAVELAFGDEYGSAEVRLGDTRVLVKMSAAVVQPHDDRKFDGLFTISTALSPMASPAFEVARPDPAEVLLSRMLEKTVRRSGALDTESLCIVAGRKCWHVRADVHVLDHDGNLADAACTALVAAMLHFRRPHVEVRGDDVTVFGLREREPVRLQTQQHQPFCVTFSSYHAGDVMLQDATWLEEQCREGELVVSINRLGDVCQMAKHGGTPVDALSLLTCTGRALETATMLDRLVREKLDEDERRRTPVALMAELRADNERPDRRGRGSEAMAG